LKTALIRRWLAPAAIAACCAPAQAGWVSYQQGPDADEWYDTAYVASAQGRVTLWTMTNHAKPLTSLEAREYQSEKTLTTIDCASGKMGAEQVIRYASRDGKGEVVGDMQTPLRLASVRAGSVDEALLKRVCR